MNNNKTYTLLFVIYTNFSTLKRCDLKTLYLSY